MAKKAGSTIAQLEKGTLKRQLGVGDLFAIGFGDLGSSIYYALGITAFFALGATPIALGLAGIVFVCTALTYAEMTAAFKDSGGSASFARHAFNDLISFIAGWGLLLDYIVTIAISIFAIGPYLAFITASLKTTSVHLGFSVALIGLLFLINVRGAKHSTRISLILTAITLLTQAAIIIVGLFSEFSWSKVVNQMHIGVQQLWSPSWGDFWKGTAMAMVAYTGIESIAQLGSETKQPAKTLPRAVILVMVVLIAMYLGISFVALSAMTPKELGTTYVDDPIAGIAANLPFGHTFFGPWIGIMAAILLFVAGNAGLLGASRLSFNMGEYYQLPRFLTKLHSKFRTPVAALALFALLAALIVLWSRGNLHFLADLYNFGAMVAFFSAHMSLIVLRIKQPKLHRPFRAPLNIPFGKTSIPLTAIIGALATFAVWCLVVITKPEGRYLGIAWMAVGIGMYFLYRRRQKIAPTGQVKLEKIKIPEYKPIEVNNILVPTKGPSSTETLQFACELAKVHGAEVTAVHILEVPFSLPLDSPLPSRVLLGQAILQRAEAIAREFNVECHTAIVRAREIDGAILDLLSTGEFDLLVLGAMKHTNGRKDLGPISDRVLKQSPCRVLICSDKTD